MANGGSRTWTRPEGCNSWPPPARDSKAAALVLLVAGTRVQFLIPERGDEYWGPGLRPATAHNKSRRAERHALR